MPHPEKASNNNKFVLHCMLLHLLDTICIHVSICKNAVGPKANAIVLPCHEWLSISRFCSVLSQLTCFAQKVVDNSA